MTTTLHTHDPAPTLAQDSPVQPDKAAGKRWLWAVEIILVVSTAALISLVNALTPPVAQAVPVASVWMPSYGDASLPDAAVALRQVAEDTLAPQTF